MQNAETIRELGGSRRDDVDKQIHAPSPDKAGSAQHCESRAANRYTSGRTGEINQAEGTRGPSRTARQTMKTLFDSPLRSHGYVFLVGENKIDGRH